MAGVAAKVAEGRPCPSQAAEVLLSPRAAGLEGFLSDIFTSLGRRGRGRRPRGEKGAGGNKREAAA